MAKFKENGKLKLLIIVGTRPEIIRLAAVISHTKWTRPKYNQHYSPLRKSVLI